MTTTAAERQVLDIKVGDIFADPDQPRQEFDPSRVRELADSMATYGLLQPITVREARPHGRFTLVTGERRWRAAKLLEWDTMPAIVLDDELETLDIRILQLLENVARVDLSPLEEARAYGALVEMGLTARDIAVQVGKASAHVTTMLGTLNARPDVQQLMEQGHVQPKLAAAMGKLDHNRQGQVLRRMTEQKLDTVQAIMLCNKLASETQQSMMLEPELSEEDAQAAREYKAAMESVGSKVKKLLDMELRQPGSLGRALAAHLELEDAAIGDLIGGLNKLRWALRRHQATVEA